MPTVPQGPRRGAPAQLTSTRKYLIQRTFAMYPELRDKMSVDEAMECIAKQEAGQAGKSEPTLPAAEGNAASDQIVAQSIAFFVNGIKSEYGQGLERIAEYRKQLDQDEKGLREQCVQDVVQYAALLARGGGRIDVEAVVIACAPLLEIIGLRAGELRELIMRGLPGRHQWGEAPGAAVSGPRTPLGRGRFKG